MTASDSARPATPPQASDLPPELHALVEGAIAQAIAPTPQRRPVVRIAADPRWDAPLTLPRLSGSKKRRRVLAPEDLVLVGLLVGL